MWTRLLLLSSVAAVAWAQTEDPQSLLLRVRANLLATIERLPKYMCSLTIDRSQYQAQYAPTLVNRPSCDGLLGDQRQGKNRPRLKETDRVRLDVAIAAADEIYSWVGEDRFDDRDLFHLVDSGALQTGGFATLLASIFRGNDAAFSYHGDITVDGRKLVEFGFQVPREKSNYAFGNRREDFIVGYEGTFLADPQTGDLMRLVVRTIDLPADTGACQATTTLDYNRVHLNDSEFLLPRDAELDILNTNGNEFRNRTVYSACHEFRGESTLKFDEPTPAPTSVTSSTVPPPGPLGIPAGLPFGLAFSQPIDAAAAAAGDRVKAKLSSDVRDTASKKILVPKGSEVMARILRMERFVGPPSSLRMVLKLETVTMGGTLHPFAATMNSAAPGFEKANGLQRSVPLGSFDTLTDPGTGVFEFPNATANFVIRSGLESAWVTIAP